MASTNAQIHTKLTKPSFFIQKCAYTAYILSVTPELIRKTNITEPFWLNSQTRLSPCLSGNRRVRLLLCKAFIGTVIVVVVVVVVAAIVVVSFSFSHTVKSRRNRQSCCCCLMLLCLCLNETSTQQHTAEQTLSASPLFFFLQLNRFSVQFIHILLHSMALAVRLSTGHTI